MNDYQQQPSAIQKLTGTIELTAGQASVIKQTYILFGVSVFCALAGGYVGATTPAIVHFFSTTVGWIVAMLLLNAVPYMALAARNNPVLGVTALVADGFVAGIAMAPLLWVASMVDSQLIYMALAISACVFLGVTGYVMMSGRTFSAPRGLMAGLFLSTIAIVILNNFHAHRLARDRGESGHWRDRRLCACLFHQRYSSFARGRQPHSRRTRTVRRHVQRVRGNAEHSAPSLRRRTPQLKARVHGGRIRQNPF
jgi:FtsH-binding integral membrane protein